MRITFIRVSQTGWKNGKCVVCGKYASRQKKFYQTLNPFNKNAEGYPKSREEIWKELAAKVKKWQEEPVKHAKCETIS